MTGTTIQALAPSPAPRTRRMAAPPILQFHAPAPTAEDRRDTLYRDLHDLVADAIAGHVAGRDWAPGIQLRIRALAAAAVPITA